MTAKRDEIFFIFPLKKSTFALRVETESKNNNNIDFLYIPLLFLIFCVFINHGNCLLK